MSRYFWFKPSLRSFSTPFFFSIWNEEKSLSVTFTSYKLSCLFVMIRCVTGKWLRDKFKYKLLPDRPFTDWWKTKTKVMRTNHRAVQETNQKSKQRHVTAGKRGKHVTDRRQARENMQPATSAGKHATSEKCGKHVPSAKCSRSG